MLDQVVQDLVDTGSTLVAKVGGCVRDELLGLKPKDVDVEVFGLSAEELASVLARHGKVDAVGVSFGVLKMRNASGEFDFTLPRRESKQGSGHRGFVVTPDSNMSFTEASLRRDFTVNSMGVNMVTGELLDPNGGRKDLENKVLRATSKYFSDDPLRPLRGMQFAARFDMTVDSDTAALCRLLRGEYKDLALERVWEEWKKFALKSVRPSAGLQVLVDIEWSKIYPEFHNILNVKQNPKFHPEIFVGLHTMFVCDAAAEISMRENLSDEGRLILLFSALCHDLAKFTHSQGTFPDITSRGHDIAGEPLAEVFLYRIGAPQWLIAHVKSLVRCHMRHLGCNTAKAAKKLAVDVEPSNLNMLALLIEADYSGRPPLPKGLPSKAKNMLELAKQENCHKGRQKAIIQGKHLIELGLCPNPKFGVIIKEVYKEQISGTFNDREGGIRWLKDNLQKFS